MAAAWQPMPRSSRVSTASQLSWALETPRRGSTTDSGSLSMAALASSRSGREHGEQRESTAATACRPFLAWSWRGIHPMTLYTLALSLHIIGAIGLFIGVSVWLFVAAAL